MSGKVKVWEFIPLPDQTKFRTGWPVHGTHSEKSPVLGHLPRHHNFQVTGFHGAWVRAQLPNGLTGWTMATYRGARVLHPVAGVVGPKSYGWQRARGHAKNYNEMLEKRRAQLRLADLAASPALLEEWYELIKELDAVLRYGFSSHIEPVPVNDGGRRKRANSFLDLFKATSAGATATPLEPVQPRKRSASFTAFFVAKKAAGAQTASTHDEDPVSSATEDLKEQRRRLLDQEQQTARAVAQAASFDSEWLDLGNTSTPAVDPLAEERMRAEAREMARKAIEAEQVMFTASIREPRSVVQGASAGGTSPSENIAAALRGELLSPESVDEAQEMSLDDIQQIVRGSGSFGSDTQTPDCVSSVSTSERNTSTGSEEVSAKTGAPDASAAPEQATVGDEGQDTAISDQSDHVTAIDEFLQLRQTKVTHGLQRMRAAAAGRTRNKVHTKVLMRHGLPTDTPHAGGLYVRKNSLPEAEAVAWEKAHKTLGQQRCGMEQGPLSPAAPEPILLTF